MITYDLSVMKGATAPGEVRINLSFGDQGELVTGTQKAAQFFTLFFLTEQGSVVGDEDFGADFMTQVRLNAIRTDDDVMIFFNLAAAQTLDYQSGNINEDTPDDEIITKLDLFNFVLQNQRLQLYVEMTTAAGDTREIVLPVSAVPVT